MHRRAARGMVTRARERAQRNRRVRRARRGDAGFRHRVSRLVGANSDARQLAHPALARAHGESSVSLESFDVIEALADAIAQVSRAHVGTKTNERSFVE